MRGKRLKDDLPGYTPDEWPGDHELGGLPPAPPPEQPVVRRLSDVQPKPVRWLHKPRVACGAITLSDGDPGIGKSMLCLDMAAATSTGRSWPPCGQAIEPAGVLLLTAEDDPETTIRPRLDAAEADLSRIYILDAVRTDDGDRPPVLPWDLDLIRDMIERQHIALIVVDPLMAYLDGRINSHQDQDVRRAMHRLKLLAEQTGTAIVIVRHLNKMVTVGTAMYRGGGSIGIIGAARSAMLVGRHPKLPEVCVVASTKSNLAPTPASFTYQIEPAGNVARIAYGPACDLTANDLLASGGRHKRQSAHEQAAQVIAELLEAGPRLAKEIEAELRNHGYGKRAIDEAKKIAGVTARPGGFGQGWIWSLATAPEPAGATEATDEGDL